VWQLPKLVAKDDDPRRVERLARLRVTFEQLKCPKAIVFADELDIHLSPKVGYAWMPKGTQITGLTPGTNERHYLAGPSTWRSVPCCMVSQPVIPTPCSASCSLVLCLLSG
jgi:hypothetical protein